MNNLIDLINQTGYTIIYPQVDKFLGVNLPMLTNFYSLQNQVSTSKNTGQFLKSKLTHINQTFKPPIAILPFKPSAKTQKLCQQHNWRYLANPPQLNRFLEDKIKFSQLCDHHRLPTIPHFIGPLSSKNFLLAQHKFGTKLVIQTRFGWAGNSTFSFDSYQTASQKIVPGTISKFSPYLDGYTLINNCCLTKHGLIQSPPARQLTGINNYTSNPFATVGRQWPSFAPKSVINQITNLGSKLSNLLQDLKYRGFFGVDFFVYQGQVMILEINPRLTASFGFYTQIEIEAGFTPLLLFHLAEFLPIDYSIDLQFEQSRLDSSLIVGTEITPKDEFGKTKNQFHQKEPVFQG
jgi:predicted ATP-grasp superfamily ATP-dependent carboligase